jgi:hypothetical protein
VNLGLEIVEIGGVHGSIALSTNPSRNGEALECTLVLGPAEGVIVRGAVGSESAPLSEP